MAAKPKGQHAWVVAATVQVSESVAAQADRRGTCRIEAEQKVDALDIYCGACRRSYKDVHDQPCIAAEDKDHLIGGPTGERKKRKHPYHDCEQYHCTIPKPQAQALAG